jgi:D-amino-acid dehydrogenase
VWKALANIGKEDSALLIRPKALPGMIPWLWSFFRNSQAPVFSENVRKNALLASYSLDILDKSFSPLGLDFSISREGTLKIFRTESDFGKAREAAKKCEDSGIRTKILNPLEVETVEPALGAIKREIVGGIFFPDDVSGDAYRFCNALAAKLVGEGVKIYFNTNVTRFLLKNGRLEGVFANDKKFETETCVVASGCWSPSLLSSTGIKLPIQPVKGYSITTSIEDWKTPPRVPVIDEELHAALCPLGGQMRVAGTAEIAGFDASIRESRIENLVHLLQRVYPEEFSWGEGKETVSPWAGFRPMSPDGVAILGSTKIQGLFLNTGHGHLGWTMAPASGKLVADLVSGAIPELPLADYGLERFF